MEYGPCAGSGKQAMAVRCCWQGRQERERQRGRTEGEEGGGPAKEGRGTLLMVADTLLMPLEGKAWPSSGSEEGWREGGGGGSGDKGGEWLSSSTAKLPAASVWVWVGYGG